MPGFNDGFFDERSSFDPSDITIDDGIDDAFLIKDSSGDEWFKIDTRAGTTSNGRFSITMAPTLGQRVLIGNPNGTTGGPFSPLMVVNQNNDSYAVRIYGGTSYSGSGTNQFAWRDDNGQPIWVHPYGGRFDIKSSSGSFDFRDSSNLTMFTMADDTSATHTLDPTSSAVFKVQDNAGTPHEYVKVDTTSGSEKITLKGRPGLSSQIVANHDPFIQGSDNNSVQLTGAGIIMNTGSSGNRADVIVSNAGNNFRVLGTGNAERFKVLDDSNATFTLESSNTCSFKVVDDAGSPTTYLAIDLDSAASTGNTTLDSKSVTFLKAQGHQYIRLSSGELQLGASGKFNVMHNGTPLFHRSPNTVGLGATSTTTIVNIQADGSNKNFKMNPSTTSQTFTFEFQDSTSANGGFVVEQHFVIQNYGSENCTIQATVTSGRGSALGKDLSAGGSTSGELVTGMTLNAGKSAVFKAVKWNKEINGSAAASDNEFMFQTIMVEA